MNIQTQATNAALSLWTVPMLTMMLRGSEFPSIGWFPLMVVGCVAALVACARCRNLPWALIIWLPLFSTALLGSLASAATLIVGLATKETTSGFLSVRSIALLVGPVLFGLFSSLSLISYLYRPKTTATHDIKILAAVNTVAVWIGTLAALSVNL